MEKILINASNLKVGGGLQVGVATVQELINNHKKYALEFGFTFVFALSSNVIEQLDIPDGIIWKRIDLDPLHIKCFWKVRRQLNNLVFNENIDKVFSVFGPTYWKPKGVPHLVGFANAWLVASIDNIAYKQLSFLNKYKLFFKNKILATIMFDKHSYFVTETLAMKNAFIGKFKQDNIFVVSNTLSNGFLTDKIPEKSKLDILDSNDSFKFLTVSHNYPHKNLAVISEVGALLENSGLDIIFVVTFPTDVYEEQSDEFKKYTINVGVLKSNECRFVYEKCNALFLPTLIECFSVSYLEAMYCKLPIATSDLPFAHSICQNAACYFNPLDVEDIANKCLEIATDDKGIYVSKEKYKEILNRTGDNESRVSSYLSLVCKI
ncbi:glycosyltransferase [Providencia rettgeri]